MKTQNKKAIGYNNKPGELLKKFKNIEDFWITLIKAELKTSTLQLSYLKNNFKAITVVFKENPIFLRIDN